MNKVGVALEELKKALSYTLHEKYEEGYHSGISERDNLCREIVELRKQNELMRSHLRWLMNEPLDNKLTAWQWLVVREALGYGWDLAAWFQHTAEQGLKITEEDNISCGTASGSEVYYRVVKVNQDVKDLNARVDKAFSNLEDLRKPYNEKVDQLVAYFTRRQRENYKRAEKEEATSNSVYQDGMDDSYAEERRRTSYYLSGKSEAYENAAIKAREILG